ncbi:isoprenoid synthase domain-containing protein [Mycena latifolia]|nr:isoprenoid synthase domain-containing protein [Mycena latifolia]
MLSDYPSCIQSLLTDLGYRFEPFPLYDANYWEPYHDWMLNTLGPASSWTVKQLTELEHAAGGVIERSYPHAGTEMKLIFAKLTAIAILVDDSIEDEAVYAQIVQFSHKLYLGEAQENGLLALYHSNLKQLSDFYGNDAVLRGLAIVPWINYIDACLMERDIFTATRAPNTLVQPGNSNGHLDALALKFPHYLRSKSGIAEAYAAGIFKANKEQSFPLSKYVRVLPDLTFYIEVMNDLLSFYKEELAGETHNLIHLRTQALSSSGTTGSGSAGEWTTYDTFGLLCDEIRAATNRIDGLLRMEECERKMNGEAGLDDIDELDVEVAKQWRGWRDGYISWHFECRRYKLGFMRAAVLGDELLE